jgi:hypothetical protein
MERMKLQITIKSNAFPFLAERVMKEISEQFHYYQSRHPDKDIMGIAEWIANDYMNNMFVDSKIKVEVLKSIKIMPVEEPEYVPTGTSYTVEA